MSDGLITIIVITVCGIFDWVVGRVAEELRAGRERSARAETLAIDSAERTDTLTVRAARRPIGDEDGQ